MKRRKVWFFFVLTIGWIFLLNGCDIDTDVPTSRIYVDFSVIQGADNQVDVRASFLQAKQLFQIWDPVYTLTEDERLYCNGQLMTEDNGCYKMTFNTPSADNTYLFRFQRKTETIDTPLTMAELPEITGLNPNLLHLVGREAQEDLLITWNAEAPGSFVDISITPTEPSLAGLFYFSIYGLFSDNGNYLVEKQRFGTNSYEAMPPGTHSLTVRIARTASGVIDGQLNPPYGRFSPHVERIAEALLSLSVQ